MNNSEKFIEKYKELENIAVSKYGNVINNKHRLKRRAVDGRFYKSNRRIK